VPRDVEANPRLSRWASVREEEVVLLRVGKVELGQGILTALAQVAAEELELPLPQVRTVPAATDLGPDQNLTAGSMSVVDAVPAVRLVAAHLRERFREAAAQRWGVEPGAVRVESGRFTCPARDAVVTYGDLAALVDTDVDIRVDVGTRTPAEATLVGTSAARLDLPDKVAGRASYIADLRLPGQLFGRVVRPPSPGARLVSVDTAFTDGGVTHVEDPDTGVHVVRDGSFLGVVAPTDHRAALAVAQLSRGCRWREQPTLPAEDDLATFLRAGPHAVVPVLDERAEPDAGSARSMHASYSRPFLAHASIAPSCGVACWQQDGSLRVWSHSQGIFRLRDAVAQALQKQTSEVVVEHVENAGCYGHNAADDAAFDAVLLARAVPGRPVMVRWSRRDELAWAPFGSAMLTDLEATVDDGGRITSWRHEVYSQGHTSRPGYSGVPGLLAGHFLEHPFDHPAADDPPVPAGGGSVRNAVPLYDVGPRCIRGHRLLRSPIRSSALRALGAHLNVFAIESFLDELAATSGVDPYQYRLRHLTDERAQAVLQTAADAAGWGAPLGEGEGRGIGLARYKERGAYCAVVAEVEAEADIRVRRLTIAVDVGRVINPDGVRNQLEGGAVQATSWTLKERVRFDRRRITSDDWESYPVLRFSETPDVEVHVLDRPDLPSVGAGEAAMGPTSAAIGNAVVAAVGVRVRDLPITSAAVVAAIESEGD